MERDNAEDRWTKEGEEAGEDGKGGEGRRVIMGGGGKGRGGIWLPWSFLKLSAYYMSRFSMRKENRSFLGSSIRPNFVLLWAQGRSQKCFFFFGGGGYKTVE